MTSLDDASSALGKYLLKGWTMLNDACPTCHTPMMRSPDRTQLICVVTHLENETPTAAAGENSTSKASSESIVSVGGSTSRPSTPPTPLSDSHESDMFVMPPPSEETLRRRAQSDLASQRIGAKMLQGYAMLAEECLNPECIGVPLLRPPKLGSKHPHKECVICNNVYVEALDSRGRTTLQLVEPSVPTPSTSTRASASQSNDNAAQASRVQAPAQTGTRPLESSNRRAPADAKGTGRLFDASATIASGNAILGDVLASVDKSLGALSARLNLLCDAEPSMLNSTLLGEAATQMGILLGVRETALRQAAHSSSL